MSAQQKQTAWTLAPGDPIQRSELARRYRVSNQGGITPSIENRLILLFTEPSEGEQYGYHDDWHNDGFFHYTGTGQVGDQLATGLNGSILRHVEDGRSLHLFRGTRGAVTYVGQFEIANGADAYYWRPAPDRNGETRSALVFRLRPLNTVVPATATASPVAKETSILNIPVEASNIEAFQVNATEGHFAARTEARLVNELRAELESIGLDVKRHRIQPAGEVYSFYTDLYVADYHALIEAKGTIGRGAIRTAIGQLADYKRFLCDPKCAILLPAKPGADIVDLLSRENIILIYKSNGQFVGLEQLKHVHR